MGKHEIFGIELFSWENLDVLEPGVVQFYGVQWSFDSMKKYDGQACEADLKGSVKIYDDEGELVYSDSAINIPEFLEKLEREIKA